MNTTRKATASLALLLTAGFGLVACGKGEETGAKESASASASASAVQELAQADKEKLPAFTRDFLSTLMQAAVPDGLPADIEALSSKIDTSGGGSSIADLIKTIEESDLTDEEKQKLDDYFKSLDPTANLYDRSSLSVGQSIGLSVVNLSMGDTLALTGSDSYDSLDIDLSKVDFVKDAATTSADSFTLTGASAGSDTSSELEVEVASSLFDGVSFRYMDGSWKVDALSYIDALEDMVAKGYSQVQ